MYSYILQSFYLLFLYFFYYNLSFRITFYFFIVGVFVLCWDYNLMYWYKFKISVLCIYKIYFKSWIQYQEGCSDEILYSKINFFFFIENQFYAISYGVNLIAKRKCLWLQVKQYFCFLVVGRLDQYEFLFFLFIFISILYLHTIHVMVCFCFEIKIGCC